MAGLMAETKIGSTFYDEESHLTLNTLSESPLKANKNKRVLKLQTKRKRV